MYLGARTRARPVPVLVPVSILVPVSVPVPICGRVYVHFGVHILVLIRANFHDIIYFHIYVYVRCMECMLYELVRVHVHY
jgi:hypothetical protein